MRGMVNSRAMARVFISFVSEDKSVAEAVQKLIEKELDLKGEVFMSGDRSQVLAGHDWLEKIRSALESCEALVLMLSMRSVRRPWINYEAGAAWILGRPVIPVCFGNLSRSALPEPYSGMQAAELPDAHYLLASIHGHLNLPGAPPGPRVLERLTAILENDKHPKQGIAAITDLMDDPYRWLEFNLKAWRDDPTA
jgi:hypothetical protein